MACPIAAARHTTHGWQYTDGTAPPNLRTVVAALALAWRRWSTVQVSALPSPTRRRRGALIPPRERRSNVLFNVPGKSPLSTYSRTSPPRWSSSWATGPCVASDVFSHTGATRTSTSAVSGLCVSQEYAWLRPHQIKCLFHCLPPTVGVSSHYCFKATYRVLSPREMSSSSGLPAPLRNALVYSSVVRTRCRFTSMITSPSRMPAVAAGPASIHGSDDDALQVANTQVLRHFRSEFFDLHAQLSSHLGRRRRGVLLEGSNGNGDGGGFTLAQEIDFDLLANRRIGDHARQFVHVMNYRRRQSS